jgi:hypothetical protein
MENKILKSVVLASLGMSLTFMSCRKSDDNDSPTSAAEEQSVTSILGNELSDVTEDVANKSNLSINNLSPAGCATITRFNSDSSNVDTAIVDFGNTGTVCQDGKTRSGQLTIIHTGGSNFRKPNSEATITTSNYTVNGNSFAGTKTIKNVTQDGGNLKFAVNVSATITTKNGAVLTHTADRMRDWMAGASTVNDRSDDVIELTGSGTATNSSSGKVWNSTILTPLVRKFTANCSKHFVQGTVEIKITRKPNRLLDFGNGECDDIATVKVNNRTFTINLK